MSMNYKILNICAGELNKETVETMSLPRCGVTDNVSFKRGSRDKRYALQGGYCSNYTTCMFKIELL